MAAWLSRSFSSAPTIRGENCPMASCTATSVRLSTTLVSVTSAVAAVLRIVCGDRARMRDGQYKIIGSD
jgi:hypothetical protein